MGRRALTVVQEEPNDLFVNLYTRSVSKPTTSQIFKQIRFILRLCQIALAIGSFACLATSTLQINYSFAVLGVSGVNFMTLVSLSSLFVSISCIVLYSCPSFLGVPPHRYERFSRIETTVDLLYVGFWIAASTTIALFNNCPRRMLSVFSKEAEPDPCIPWNLCFSLGYCTAAAFTSTFVLGCRDICLHGWFNANIGVVPFQGARGNWKDS